MQGIMIRTLPLTLALLVAMALLVPSLAVAAAVANDEIYEDAADGYLDGDYTLEQVQSANGNVPTQTREYTLWDDIYADYVRRLRDPDAPRAPIAEVVDVNDNGIIDQDDVQVARVKTRELQAEARAERRDLEADDSGDDEPGSSDDGDDDEPGSSNSSSGGNSSGSSGSSGSGDSGDSGSSSGSDAGTSSGGVSPLLLASMLVVPAGVIGVGIWRMRRSRASDMLAMDEIDI